MGLAEYEAVSGGRGAEVISCSVIVEGGLSNGGIGSFSELALPGCHELYLTRGREDNWATRSSRKGRLK